MEAKGLRMGEPWSQSECGWGAENREPDTPHSDVLAGPDAGAGGARNAKGLEAASQSGHDSGGRAGPPANGKQGLRKASRKEAGGWRWAPGSQSPAAKNSGLTGSPFRDSGGLRRGL